MKASCPTGSLEGRYAVTTQNAWPPQEQGRERRRPSSLSDASVPLMTIWPSATSDALTATATPECVSLPLGAADPQMMWY